ncbi:two-component sensor histidine kinase [Christensenellaceae bacterium]|nr:two-component sensor histidine kinase [Christensenellaceae bacterium]BDF62006.1 two-component sensor histidine kinase [Christensenellaceae bacterium]
MIKTIFGKIMLLFMAIIMVSLFISGMMMSWVVRNAYLDDSEQQMLSVANDVDTLLSFYKSNYLTFNQMAAQILVKAETNKDVIWIVNSDGTVWQAVDPSGQTSVTNEEIQMYFEDMIAELQKGNAVKVVTEESNFFNTPVITVAKPVMSDTTVTGYVFVHKKIGELEASLMAMYRQIVLAACISAALGIILTYLFSKSMLRPLSVVNTGAKQLAKGRFDIRLDVSSKDEIGQLADTFNSVASELRKYEATRESLVANVSHELRSPLTSMQGLLQGVIDGTIPREEAEHYLGVVLDETKRLGLLISDMLDLAKIESGQFPMQIEKVELSELLRRTLITFESKIEAKKLEVSVDLPDEKQYVYADENRLKQVLHNVIENAIKFVNEGGELKVSTLATEASIFVNINNSGEPIPREDLPYLFDRFYKIDKSHSRAKEGTGIGLSIVKNILKEHGQKIWVTSNAQDGTTFTFTLKKV